MKEINIKTDIENNFKIELITVNDNLVVQFFGVPDNYELSNVGLEGFKTEKIGRLKSFNRLKLFRKQKSQGQNLVKIFTEFLNIKKWDFDKFPNPIAYGSFR